MGRIVEWPGRINRRIEGHGGWGSRDIYTWVSFKYYIRSQGLNHLPAAAKLDRAKRGLWLIKLFQLKHDLTIQLFDHLTNRRFHEPAISYLTNHLNFLGIFYRFFQR